MTAVALSKPKRRITERRLVDVLIRFLKTSHKVARELPHYEKRIDVAAVSLSSGELLSVEAKVENWPKAISQAMVNLSASHKSYIAIYSKYAHRVPEDLLMERGIGLISVGTKWDDVEILIEAQESPFRNGLVVERLTLAVEGKA